MIVGEGTLFRGVLRFKAEAYHVETRPYEPAPQLSLSAIEEIARAFGEGADAIIFVAGVGSTFSVSTDCRDEDTLQAFMLDLADELADSFLLTEATLSITAAPVLQLDLVADTVEKYRRFIGYGEDGARSALSRNGVTWRDRAVLQAILEKNRKHPHAVARLGAPPTGHRGNRALVEAVEAAALASADEAEAAE